MVVLQYKLIQHFSQFCCSGANGQQGSLKSNTGNMVRCILYLKWSVKVVKCLTFVLKCLENLQAPQCGNCWFQSGLVRTRLQLALIFKMKTNFNCFQELDLKPNFGFHLFCGTGTETFLVCFKIRTGANLHKSKQLPNTGF
jgi:hypothetical protein